MIIDARIQVPRRMTDDEPEVEEPAYMARYHQLLGTDEGHRKTFAQLEEEMEAAGIRGGVMHAEYTFGDPADGLNERVAQIVSERRDRFVGVGTVSIEPLTVTRAIAQVKRCAELGLKGINIQLAFGDIDATDRRLYPVYAKAEELGLVMALHTGVNYARNHSISHGAPLALDVVACDFPELTLIACHAGWPWAAEMAAVARRHPNVYVEFGGMAPKYLGEPDAGWSVLFRFVRSLLQDQALFATDWPVFGFERAVREWRELPLKPDVLEKVLSGNVRRIFPGVWDE